MCSMRINYRIVESVSPNRNRRIRTLALSNTRYSSTAVPEKKYSSTRYPGTIFYRIISYDILFVMISSYTSVCEIERQYLVAGGIYRSVERQQ